MKESEETADDERATVERTAKLARLEIPAADVARHAEHFARILAAFRALGEVDCEGVEPMTGPTDVADVTREDRDRPSLTVDQALGNAPERIEGFYSVPKTIGGANESTDKGGEEA